MDNGTVKKVTKVISLLAIVGVSGYQVYHGGLSVSDSISRIQEAATAIEEIGNVLAEDTSVPETTITRDPIKVVIKDDPCTKSGIHTTIPINDINSIDVSSGELSTSVCSILNNVITPDLSESKP